MNSDQPTIWSPQRNYYRRNDVLQNTKAIVRSLDRGTDLFDIVIGVLQGDISTPYLFIFC